MPAICRTQSDLLPEGWKASKNLQNNIGTFKYCLNDMKTLTQAQEGSFPSQYGFKPDK